MEVVQGWVTLPREPGVVLTIGVFDGVHLGHQALIRRVVERARTRGGRAVVLTFHPHPRSIVAPRSRWGYLCSLEERIARIAELGVDLLVVLRFTPQLAAMPAEAFVRELVGHMPLVELHVGADFGLGKDRRGDVALLERLGRDLGFDLYPASPVCLDGRVVSSTHIRALIQAGQVAEAGRWLGRRFSLRGEVVAGAGRGRRLGFPTANLHLHPRQLLPADGVYAVWVRLPPAWDRPSPHPGLAYIGRRPTFGPGRRAVEVHLLDFSGDLLGCEVRAEFVERLRPEQAFPGPAELIAQMELDVARARAILGRGDALSVDIAGEEGTGRPPGAGGWEGADPFRET
ncbi:MAG: bifunctional riboflavin kinase/FAD synthetase [Chloroflexia bacterium]